MPKPPKTDQPPKTGQPPKDAPKPGWGGFGRLLDARERKVLLINLAIGIILVEFAVTVFALGTCIASAKTLADGTVRFQFPWAAYLTAVVLAPVAVMLVAHIVGLGFNRLMAGDPVMSPEQLETMPPRLRRLITLVQGAPTIILLTGLMVLGLLLYYLDAVMGFVVRLGDHAEKVALWVTVGLVTAWCVGTLARAWFLYKTRRLEAEYAFRREVLERTGVIITDGNQLPPGPPVQPLPPGPAPLAIDVSPAEPRKDRDGPSPD